MNYGGAPMVPTYDYGPSDRSLGIGGASTRSFESGGNSTLADTVINQERSSSQRANVPSRTNYQAEPKAQRNKVIEGGDEQEDYVYDDNKVKRNNTPPIASNSPEYSTTSSNSKSPEQQYHDNQRYSSASYSPAASETNSNLLEHSTMTAAASTIAVFGATTKTGQAFCRLALDAGYLVRALLGNSKKLNEQTNLSWIVGSLNDDEAVRACVCGADYVFCSLAEHQFKKQKHLLREFVQRLYPIMKEQTTIQVFLFQSCSLATDLNGKTPVLSKIVKSVTKRGNQSIRDQDFIVKFINAQHQPDEQENVEGSSSNNDSTKPLFSFLITRPTVLIKDGPSSKKLAPSKSQPGFFSITHIDLAEFSLNALRNRKLYNTCPYVVADCGL
ncbi:hypothetical protein MPSEU_000924500 [Mayamaea pseudoterrestris]|nr:hypothetical protein MPSEU_000924500 [Mayamaea pseudoterrestris]